MRHAFARTERGDFQRSRCVAAAGFADGLVVGKVCADELLPQLLAQVLTGRRSIVFPVTPIAERYMANPDIAARVAFGS